jgi:hypothetical protein
MGSFAVLAAVPSSGQLRAGGAFPLFPGVGFQRFFPGMTALGPFAYSDRSAVCCSSFFAGLYSVPTYGLLRGLHCGCYTGAAAFITVLVLV